MSEPTFLSRSELGMTAPRSISRNIDTARGGVMSHWGGGPQRISSLDEAKERWLAWQRMHMRPGGLGATNGGVDIGYNAGFWKGYVFAGRGLLTRSGANGTNDANFRYVAFVWIGGSGETPTDEDYATFNWMVENARENGAGLEVKTHNSVRPTSCPGPDWIRHAANIDGSVIQDKPTPKPRPEPDPRPEPEPKTWTETLVENLPTRRQRANLSTASDWDRRIQGLLAAAGSLPIQPNIDRNGRFDGKFGPSTDRSVKSFQRSASIGVDGIVGPQTWTKLLGR